MSVTSRVDSYLAGMTMKWGSQNKAEKETKAMVGAVECYKQVGDVGEYKFEKLWTKPSLSQVIKIYWDQASCLLLIGYLFFREGES